MIDSYVEPERYWRSMFSPQVGGVKFDAPGGGYSFQMTVDDEREKEKANRTGDPASALLKLSVADPTWKMPEGAMDAARDYFNLAWDASRYTDTTGARRTACTIMTRDTNEMLAELVQRLRGAATQNGKGLTADWVQYSPGAIKRALAESIPTLLFDQNTELIFPTPSYQVITSPMNSRGVPIVYFPLVYWGGKWAFKVLELTDWVTAAHNRSKKIVMYLNVPHNPTGMGFTLIDWRMIIAWANSNKVTLVVDEAYIDLCYRDGVVSVLQVPGWEKCCIVLQSVSKGWNATGLRFGWVVAHPTVIQALRKVMDVKDSGMFGLSIVAGLYCLLHPEVAQETVKKYRMLHQKLADGLKAAGFKGGMPDAGLCQFTPAPKAVKIGHLGFDDVLKPFKDAADCAKWFRETLRISVMHAEAAGGQWLRWAVTLQPVPECGLPTGESIINEVVRRLQSVKFTF